MIALKSILVPTDFSETSMVAVRYGAALARAFGARLSLLHVVHESFTDDIIAATGDLFDDYDVVRTIARAAIACVSHYRAERAGLKPLFWACPQLGDSFPSYNALHATDRLVSIYVAFGRGT